MASGEFRTTRVPANQIIYRSTSAVSVIEGTACAIELFVEPDTDSYVLFDLGREIHGRFRLTCRRLTGAGSATLRVALGESVLEAIDAPFVRVNREVGETTLAVATELTGFRFALVRLIADDPLVRIQCTEIAAEEVVRDLDAVGTFRCSDPLITEIWEVGARTTHLCMQEYLFDGIKRGRTVWIGDLYPAARVVSNVFGKVPIIPDSLDVMRDESISDGDINWMNGISSYSLWWIIIQQEWFRHHGDLKYLLQQRDYLRRLLLQLFTRIDDGGSETLDRWRFVDWAVFRDEDATHAGLQALFVRALIAASDVLMTLGDESLAGECIERAKLLSSVSLGSPTGVQVRAELILAGLMESSVNALGLHDKEHFATLTPFLGYDVLRALSMSGAHGDGLELIRRFWGAMLAYGGTTFWEDFSLEWTNQSAKLTELTAVGDRHIHADFGRCQASGLSMSLCHAWSAGPTAWLSEEILGVHPVEPGFALARVTPKLGDLDWVEGSIPTPFGPILIEAEKSPLGGEALLKKIELPSGIAVV